MTAKGQWWRHQANFILFDSCFWIGLIGNESMHYRSFLEFYIDRTFLMPYPSFAEFLNDIPLKHELKLKILRDVFLNKAVKIQYYKYNLTDSEKDCILNEYFSSPVKIKGAVGPNFVDIIIGRIIKELNFPFAFATLNFSDFSKYGHNKKAPCWVVDFKKEDVFRW